MATINYWAVGTCTILNIFLGALWYSPLLFGLIWTRLMDFDYQKMKTDPNVQKQAQKGYLLSSMCHLIMSIVLAHLIEYTHATDSWFDGFKIGFLCWLGFTLTTMLPNHIFSKPNVPWLVAAINLGYPMIGLSTAGAILGAWH